MFKKIKVTLLAATMVFPSAVYASALTAETPVAISEPVTAVPIYEVAGSGMTDNELLEAAITAAKKYVGDTERFATLTHSISDNNGTKVVYLYWSDCDTDGEYLSAAIGEDGTLYRFSLQNDGEVGLPIINKSDAVKVAYMYAMKVNPIYSWISEDHATVSYSRWNGYQVTFQSMYNGYAVEDNDISVTVSPEGRVTGYNAFDMARGVSVPETATALISSADAKTALKTSLPLELVYKSFYSYDSDSREYKAVIKLVYKLADDYESKAVDAVTGELIGLQPHTYYYGDMEAAAPANGMSAADSGSKLSEAEQKAVELQAGLLTASDIDAAIREVTAFGFTENLSLNSSTLYSVKSPYDGTMSYRWSLNYESSDSSIDDYVTADAETGEVISFSSYNGGDYKSASDFAYTSDQCKNATEQLLFALYGDKFGSYVETENTGVQPLTDDNQISSYTFNYVRTVNGVKFPSDTVSVTVNPDTLGVMYLDFGYTDTAFPTVSGAIDAYAAADDYFGVVALKPYYIVSLGISDGMLQTPDVVYSADEKQLTPVYAYTYNGYIDAMSGALLGGDGEPADYTPVKYFDSGVTFVDLGNSAYANAVNTLWNMDVIIMDGVRFRPDDAITAAELETLLQNAGYWYSDDGDETETAETVSVEDALYSVVCALGYSDIAEIDAIFKNPYGDSSDVSEGRVGAVAISSALGLLNGIAGEASLNATAPLTRGQAAQLVYNLILHENAKG